MTGDGFTGMACPSVESCNMCGEYSARGAETNRQADAGGDALVELGEKFQFGKTYEAGEASNFEVDVTRADYLDERAALTHEFGDGRGFGESKPFLHGEKDGVRAEGKRPAKGCAGCNAGCCCFGRAGGNRCVLFRRATNNDGAAGELRVLAPGECDEEVGHEQTGNFHGLCSLEHLFCFGEWESVKVLSR